MADDKIIPFRPKAADDQDEYLIACVCGCAMFRLWADGEVECLNCAGIMADLHVDTGEN